MIIGGGFITLSGSAPSGDPPAAPTDVVASDAYPNVAVNWVAGIGGDPVDQYRIEVSLNSGAYSFLSNPLTESYSDSTSYITGDTVKYRVRAENAYGTSIYAESNTFVIPTPP